MGYRPLRLSKGWREATIKELIREVESYLYEFTKTDAWDRGVRLSEVEAYLQGLKDAKKLLNNK